MQCHVDQLFIIHEYPCLLVVLGLLINPKVMQNSFLINADVLYFCSEKLNLTNGDL